MKKKSPSRRKAKPSPRAAPEVPAESPAPTVTFPVVGIGASAGGLEACSDLLRHLPERTGMAFVVVQHLDPTHGSMLHELLARTTNIPVQEVKDGVPVEPDHVYVMPPNTDMVIENGMLRLGARALTRGQHMPIDRFFRTLANERGNRAIGVILSGTASDGTEGCTAIKAEGGITFAQDENTAKYSSMPRSAIHAGCVDLVRPPEGIAKELARIGRHPYIAPAVRQEPAPEIETGSDMQTLFTLLREATGVDFANYKQSTFQRRVKRRMVLHRLEKLKGYLEFIRGNPTELDQLYKDILIHVTSFFREPGAFDSLREHVFPTLFQNRKNDDSPIRVWIPGCSTGEEVYSIAITLLEYVWQKARNIAVAEVPTKAIQIFATDLSDTALDRARNGLYTEAAVADVSPERLKRFFVRLDGGYQINKPIRDMCIFAKQNLAKDPPFSNLDLVSCRNLLIYLGPVLQKRVVPTLHYALNPGGYLLLGGSENLGAFADHFKLLDKKYKIYQKKRTATRLITYFTGSDYAPRRAQGSKTSKGVQAGLSVEKEVERVLVNRFVPASIVVNDEMEIVQFRGHTGAYLEPAAGHPTFSLSKMAREGLLVDLRAAIAKAKQANDTVRKPGVFVRSDGGTREVDLEVIPVRGQGSHDRFYVVVFEEPALTRTSKGGKRQKTAKTKTAAARETDRVNREVAQLREQLQALIEEHEMTTEEFKSANEEVLSANEELQSTNEELETAKEELQSSNEELTTLNEELQNRNIELSMANNDLLNLLGNVNIPVVMVGNDLRIRRFTPPAEKLLNLIPADLGRRLSEIRSNLEIDDLDRLVRESIESATLHELEVREKDGTWYLMRVRPYKTWDNKIEGGVISLQDIDVFKRSLDQSRRFADTLIENAREPIVVLDGSLRVSVANPAFYRQFRATPENTEQRLIYDLGNGQWNIPQLRELLEEAMQNNARVDDFEVHHQFAGIGNRTMILNARRVEPQPGRQMIFLSIQDVTEERQHLDALNRLAALLEHAHDTIIVRDRQGTIQVWNRGAEEMYGWTEAEALGMVVYELLQTQFSTPLEEIWAELERSGHWHGELVHTRKDGERRIVDSRWALQKEAEEYVILEINSDITDRKRTEESMRQLSGYLLRVQDEERRRIARELHDSTGQKLVALKMILSVLEKQATFKAKGKSSLEESITLVDEATNEIRTLSQLLHPPMLDEAGLVSATRWLVDRFAARAGLKLDIEVSSEIGRLPENLELALFRVIQESLNNIHRHSGAKRGRIVLALQDTGVILEISDNGKGMPEAFLATGQDEKLSMGVGILGMRERLAQLGGRLEISSSKKGTTVKASVPLPKKMRAAPERGQSQST